MLDRRLEFYLVIINQMTSLKKYEFKQLVEKYIERRLLQKLHKIQVIKTYMFKVLFVFFLDVFQYQKRLEILKQKDPSTEVILT
jgi:hypothetical protein